MSPEAETTPPSFAIGRQFLVVIAVGRYQSWPVLQHPVRDAQEIREILVDRYRIDQVRELYDEKATKAGIMRLFADLQKEVGPDDSLLVVYSGHGHLDKKSDSGFWIPVDAGTDVYEQRNWLPHSQLKGLVSNMASAHVLIVSDSCFSGDLLASSRSLPAEADAGYFQKAYSLVCRQVLTSGAAEAVPDSSDFAVQLKSALRRNAAPYLDSLTLYDEVRRGVKSSVPLLGALPGTGNQEGAGFLLFLRDNLLTREPAPPQGASADGGRRKTAFRVGGGLGLTLPVLEGQSVLSPGPSFTSYLLYSVPTRFGNVGIAFVAGAMSTSTSASVPSRYTMLSVPVGLGFRYETFPSSSLFLRVDASGGALFSYVKFSNPGTDPVSTAKPFVQPSFSAGWLLFERLRISAGVGWGMFFFDGVISMVIPFLGAEYEL